MITHLISSLLNFNRQLMELSLNPLRQDNWFTRKTCDVQGLKNIKHLISVRSLCSRQIWMTIFQLDHGDNQKTKLYNYTLYQNVLGFSHRFHILYSIYSWMVTQLITNSLSWLYCFWFLFCFFILQCLLCQRLILCLRTLWLTQWSENIKRPGDCV